MSEIKEFNDKCIIVNIPKGACERDDYYEATRRCWRANLQRARKADYVLGTNNGEVICVIKINNCDFVKEDLCNKEMEICKKKFNTNIELCKKNKRIAFVGKEMKNDEKYLNKIIPNNYIPKQNPVRYTYE